MKLIATTSTPPRIWLALAATCGALLLAGCDKNDTRTVGEKVDAGLAKTEQAADTAAAKTKDALAEAKARIDSSSVPGEASLKQGAANVMAAAKGAGASLGATIDDASVTASVSAGLAKDVELSAVKIDVDTKGGAVTLKGPSPSAAAKLRATEIAKAVNGVMSVDNQLDVKM